MNPDGAPDLGADVDQWQRWIAAVSTAALLAVSLVFGSLSDGSNQDDGLAHYLYARWAWHDPQALLDVWGRPGMTALYALPARLGWWACRIESAVLSAAAAWLAYLTARQLGLRRAEFVPLLLLAQPLFMALSYDTFTETAAAFYLALAVWLIVTGRSTASSAVLSLCFVTRYETAVLALPWCAALWWRSARWHAYVALALGPLAHNLAGAVVLEDWPLAIMAAQPHLREYGAGTPLSMFLKSLIAAGPAVGVLALVGCTTEKLKAGRGIPWLLPAVYLVHLAVQSVLYWAGAFSTGGYSRFFVTTAPIAAVLALNGIHRLLADRRASLLVLIAVVALAWLGIEIEPPPRDEVWLLVYDKARPLVRMACAAILALAAVGLLAVGHRKARGIALGGLAVLGGVSVAVLSGHLVRPHRLSDDARDIASAVQWLRRSGLDARPIVTTHIWTSHFLASDRNLTASPGTDLLNPPDGGAVLIWDARYSPSERFGLTLEQLASDSRWTLLWTSPPRTGHGPLAPSGEFVRIYQSVEDAGGQAR